jgi:hypothetical protein
MRNGFSDWHTNSSIHVQEITKMEAAAILGVVLFGILLFAARSILEERASHPSSPETPRLDGM